MTKLIQDVMTRNPEILRSSSTIMEAARTMRDSTIGDVLVLDEMNRLCGIVTDRDLVVRALASGSDPQDED
jgi:CBS domain-containing protein